ncbi:MAG: hypothetical protein E5V41_28065 [Mesorhizobium sp.]|nr:MAG: hypothetical protein E5V41_28065 [Mesorhizobium sp.]
MFDGQFYPGLQPQFDAFAQLRRPYYRARLKDVLTTLGLTTNLKLCLDAADGNSLPAASTKWLDTSGGGYDFFRGTTAGADATDPTINGTADGRTSSEYLSFDGGDYLTYDTTNETWMTNIHKDNAKWTVAIWAWYGSAASNGIGGTSGNNVASVGFHFGMSGGQKWFAAINNGSGVVALQNIMVATLATGSWVFAVSSLDEAVGANGHILGVNSTFELFSSTYSSPSAAGATNTMQIGSRGNAQVPLVNTSRMAAMAMWEGTALTQAQLDGIFQATRKRFGV